MTFWIIIISTLLSLTAQKQVDSVVVVVDQSVDVESITKKELREIYTLKKQNWQDGNRIFVADYKGSNHLRSEFYDKMGYKITSIKRIWLRAQFTGTTIPPKVVTSPEEMKKIVTTKPGTIGYLPKKEVETGQKIILVL